MQSRNVRRKRVEVLEKMTIRIYETEKGYFVTDPQNIVFVRDNALHKPSRYLLVRSPGITAAELTSAADPHGFFVPSSDFYEAG